MANEKCNVELGDCVCKKDKHNLDIPHECVMISCGGIWTTDENGELKEAIRYPGRTLERSRELNKLAENLFPEV